MPRVTFFALLLLIPAMGRAQTFSFHNPTTYPAQKGPVATATADFDGDGNADIAIANAASQSISILLGKGDGTFNTPTTLTLPAQCNTTYVAAADFNGDGRPDLLAVCGLEQSLWVILNTGGGHFATPLLTQLPAFAVVGYFVEVNLQGVAVGDFDRDGKLDLAIDLAQDISNTVDWSLYLLRGNGDGTFQPAVSVLPFIPSNGLEQPAPSGVVAGDFNGDGNLDLAVTIIFIDTSDCSDLPPAGSLFILLGDGHGQFRVQGSSSISAVPFIGTVIAADLNGDSKLDLILAGPVSAITDSNGDTTSITSAVTVFNGHGDGTFTQGFTDQEPGLTLGMAVADFRGTGKLDLAEADTDQAFTTFQFEIRQGNGDGTFRAPTSIPISTQGSLAWVTSLVIGDWNGDGLPDLAIPQIPAQSLEALASSLNNSNSGGSGVSNSDQVLAFFNQLPAGTLAVMTNALVAPPLITAVVNGASFQPGIEAGSWVTIFGERLATKSRPWAASDFNGNNLPLALDGTSVTIDGKPAAVYFIDPKQLDVQAPDDSNTGPVSVVVKQNGIPSPPFSAQLQSAAPAFFLYTGTNYAIASHLNFTLVGNPSVIPGTTGATPNEVIILWGTGFGATSPATPAGALFSGARAVAALPTVKVNGAVAGNIGTVLSPGSVGLYQVAVQLPSPLPPGPVSIQATVGNAQSPDGIDIFIANP